MPVWLGDGIWQGVHVHNAGRVNGQERGKSRRGEGARDHVLRETMTLDMLIFTRSQHQPKVWELPRGSREQKSRADALACFDLAAPHLRHSVAYSAYKAHQNHTDEALLPHWHVITSYS